MRKLLHNKEAAGKKGGRETDNLESRGKLETLDGDENVNV